ncbi:MAG: hypothetical protein MZV63_40180 [Marinilabiliales bacterium]|nr:hypothetical protein [Marinilabiliales bacterium]
MYRFGLQRTLQQSPEVTRRTRNSPTPLRRGLSFLAPRIDARLEQRLGDGTGRRARSVPAPPLFLDADARLLHQQGIGVTGAEIPVNATFR